MRSRIVIAKPGLQSIWEKVIGPKTLIGNLKYGGVAHISE